MTTLVAPIATPAARTMGFIERLHAPERPVLVFDGATGTSLQQMDLSAADFGGAALEGCTKIWFSPAPTRYRRCIASFWRPVVM